MSLETSDREAAAVATAPRVSLADIQNAIVARYDCTADKVLIGELPAPLHQALRTVTLCFLVFDNGFTVIGKSAPASAVNFDKGLGEKIAYEDAIRQAWPLFGFALRSKLTRDG